MSALLEDVARGDRAAALAIADSRPISVHEAAALGDVAALRRALDADPAGTAEFGPGGHTALGLASAYGHDEAVAFLLSAGADPSLGQLVPGGHYPLHAALANGHVEIASRLLAAGADANEPNSDDWTPLHFAAKRADARAVDVLISAGARTGYPNREGHTALDYAELALRPDLADRIARTAIDR